MKTARYILFSACAVMVLFFLVAACTKNVLFIFLGGAVAFIGVAFWIVFGRCPSCGEFLGRTYDKHCPHCGEKIK